MDAAVRIVQMIRIALMVSVVLYVLVGEMVAHNSTSAPDCSIDCRRGGSNGSAAGFRCVTGLEMKSSLANHATPRMRIAALHSERALRRPRASASMLDPAPTTPTKTPMDTEHRCTATGSPWPPPARRTNSNAMTACYACDRLCDVIVCGSDVKKGKPHPDLFRFVLKKLELHQHSAAIAIGDTPFDAMAAQATGMGAVGVLTGGHTAQELEHAGCALVIPQVADLPARPP